MDDLAAGERRIDASTVRTSLLVFWLKTDLVLTDKRLVGTVPNALLGLIPLDRREITQPLDRISNVGFETKFHFLRAVLGLLLVSTSVTLLSEGTVFWGLIGLVVSLATFSWSWVARITVTDNSGKENNIPVSALDNSKISRFLTVVNRTVVEGASTPDSSPLPPPPSPDTRSVRIEELKDITALRDAGTLTGEEFAAEKKRILGQ